MIIHTTNAGVETKDAMFDNNHTDAAADDDRRSKILKT